MDNGWENAPLVYVVGMVRFSRLSLDDKIEKIHDLLRIEYPQISDRKNDVQEITFDASSGAPEVKKRTFVEWSFTNAASSAGVLIRSDSVFLHTTVYVDHSDFERRIHRVLEAINNVVNIGYIQSVGLRYIDVIQGVGEIPADQCIQSALMPMNIAEGDETQNTIIQMEVTSGDVIMNCRCVHVGDMPKEKVPVDLRPLRALLSAEADGGLAEGGYAIVLDADCVYQPKELQEFDADMIVGVIEKELHTRTSRAFKSATTKEARKEWKGERS